MAERSNRDRSSVSPSALDRLLALGAAATVLALGAVRVGDRAYWADEGATKYIVRLPWTELVSHLWSREAGMGPYYLALWAWRHVFASDSGMRWFSVVGGAIAAALVVWLGCRWFGRATAIAAGVVFVGNPFFLRYLTELRAYSWVMAGSVATVAALAVLVERPSTGRATAVGGLAGLTVATHSVFVLWLVAAGVSLLVARGASRPPTRLMIVAGATGTVVLAPFVPTMLRRSDQLDWIAATTIQRVAQVGQATFGGVVLAVVLGLGVVALIVSTIVVTRTGARPELATVLVLAMAVVGPVLLVTVSLVKPLLVLRYLSPALPFIALAAVEGWRSIARRVAALWSSAGRPDTMVAAVGAIPVVVALAVFVYHRPLVDTARPEDPRAAAEWVVERVGPDDLVIVDRPKPYGPIVVFDELERVDVDAVSGGDLDVDAPPVTDAPTVYVFTWSVGGRELLDPSTERLLATREVERVEFGLTSVLVAER